MGIAGDRSVDAFRAACFCPEVVETLAIIGQIKVHRMTRALRGSPNTKPSRVGGTSSVHSYLSSGRPWRPIAMSHML